MQDSFQAFLQKLTGKRADLGGKMHRLETESMQQSCTLDAFREAMAWTQVTVDFAM